METHLNNSTQAFTNSKWIGQPDACLHNWEGKILPAPYFRKEFNITDTNTSYKISICGLGYYELYLNGKKVGDHVLDPVVTHYDKRVRYVVYDVTEYLVEGENIIGAILGNGWYNCHTGDVWHFDKASWRNYPRLILGMERDNQQVLVSDDSWKVTTGPIVFDGLRNGETYDARLELDNWLSPDYDDSNWKTAGLVTPPGGIFQKQTMPPCKVTQTLSVSNNWDCEAGTVYDIGQNMTGWARITVQGDEGAEITIRYAEKLLDNKSIDQSNINVFIKTGDCQTDRYILSGNGQEVWEPRFTYHGFQYVQVEIKGNASIEKVEGRVVNTAFDKLGEFECSSDIVNRLQECTIWSYIGNFTGIPTDCPHREKNGWTGDAQLAAETGLFNFDATSSYAQWMDSIVDSQRPSGQLPGIVPSDGWGFNWGSGPAWDCVIFLLPWYAYVYKGDSSIIETHYDAIKKYIDYLTLMSKDHIVSIGLGDWCHHTREKIVTPTLTSTAYYYNGCSLLVKFAEITGRSDDQKEYSELADKIKNAFNQHFYKGDGIYADGEQTAMACALYQELVEDSEKEAVVQQLLKSVEANEYKVDFGILGSKYVLRALADNGHADAAYKIMTQPAHPGWVNWLNQGATTLWESWHGESSLNHIMFGDISAWMYQYLAGITPDPANPGFKHVTIKPNPVSELTWVKAEHKTPNGTIKVSWSAENNKFKLDIDIPAGTEATVIMPDSSTTNVTSGKQQFICNLSS